MVRLSNRDHQQIALEPPRHAKFGLQCLYLRMEGDYQAHLYRIGRERAYCGENVVFYAETFLGAYFGATGTGEELSEGVGG